MSLRCLCELKLSLGMMKKKLRSIVGKQVWQIASYTSTSSPPLLYMFIYASMPTCGTHIKSSKCHSYAHIEFPLSLALKRGEKRGRKKIAKKFGDIIRNRMLNYANGYGPGPSVKLETRDNKSVCCCHDCCL